MNQFKRLSIALVCMLAVSYGYAFPFIHTVGILGDILQEETTVTVCKDTVPRSLDDQLKSLDRAEQQLTKELVQKNWLEVEKSMQQVLAKLNSGEIQEQLVKARKNLEKASLHLSEQLTNAGLSKEAIEVELKKLQQSLEQLTIDQHKLQAELKEQKLQIQEQLKAELPKMEAELTKAKAEIAIVKKELSGYKEMISRMVAEGLLPDEHNYSIEYSEAGLFINGKEQPKSIVRKYNQYFPKNKKTKLENNNRHVNIQSDSQ